MTSKISFFKLMRENLRHRGWLMILMFFINAFLLPINFQMRLENVLHIQFTDMTSNQMKVWVEQNRQLAAEQVLGPSNGMIMAAVLVAALLCGVTGFAYLHSKEKVDFYHSIAVRRRQLFLIQYLSGIIIAAVPYVVCVLIAVLGVGTVNGIVTAEIVSMALGTMGFFCLGFIAAYTVCVLAMLLTGRILTGILGTIFFWGYGPMCFWVIRNMMVSFFDTYCTIPGSTNPGTYFSPVTLMIYMGKQMGLRDTVPALMWLILPGILAAALLLCFLVYEKRPSEAAECALSYPRSEGIVKIMISIPAALSAGMAVRWFAGYDSRGWFVFTAVLAALFLNCIIEFVFSTDLKNIWTHKYSCGFILGGVGALLIIFLLDPLGYDRWQPDTGEVEEMSLYSYRIYEPFMEYYSATERLEATLLEKGGLSNYMPLYGLADEGIKAVRFDETEDFIEEVVLCYHLKGGKKAYRRYQVSGELLEQTLEDLSQDEEFREKYYPACGDGITGADSISVTDWADYRDTEQKLNLSREALLEFIGLFREESKKVTIGELRETQPSGILRLSRNEPVDTGRQYAMGTVHLMEDRLDEGYFYLYPQFEKTLDFLERMGIVFQNEINPEDINGLRLEIEQNSDEGISAETENGYAAAAEVSEIHTFYKKKDIEQVLSCIERCRYSDYREDEKWIYIILTYKDGSSGGGNCRITDVEKMEQLLKNSEPAV